VITVRIGDAFDNEVEGGAPTNLKLLTKKMRPICTFCGLICGLVWFQQKRATKLFGDEDGTKKERAAAAAAGGNEPAMTLCIKCFVDNNYPNILSPNDFTKVDLLAKLAAAGQSLSTAAATAAGGKGSDRPWTIDETTRLLDAIFKHGENWSEIAKEFPQRTTHDLVMHFLQLPLKHVTQIPLFPDGDQSVKEAKKHSAEQFASSSVSIFHDGSNPIIHHVAAFKMMLDKVKKQQKQRTNAQSGQVKQEDDEKSGKGTKMMEEEQKAVVQMENESRAKATVLKEAKEEKIHQYASELIDIQLEKLDTKLSFLEELEKSIWHERSQLEIMQRMNIAERVNLAFRRNELLRTQKLQGGETRHHHAISSSILNDGNESRPGFGGAETLPVGAPGGFLANTDVFFGGEMRQDDLGDSDDKNNFMD
jgi:SWI/SNF related-matrix-associated actin-dependent regulator of chromatin subfamily C